MKNTIILNLLPIKTTRLTLKKLSLDDVDMLLKMDKQEETQKYLGGIKNKTKDERIKFIEKKLEKMNNNSSCSLTVYLENTPIGMIGLSINENDNNAEISYIFDQDYCGNGYCTEASKKLIDLCFNKLDLNRVFANTIDGNIPSKRVLEKLGFIHEGTRKEAAFVNTLNEYRDFLDYGILKRNYVEESKTNIK